MIIAEELLRLVLRLGESVGVEEYGDAIYRRIFLRLEVETVEEACGDIGHKVHECRLAVGWDDDGGIVTGIAEG